MTDVLGRGLGRTLEWILITLMVSLTTLVIVAVIYRKSGASLSFYDEVASVMLAWITYYGAALAALRASISASTPCCWQSRCRRGCGSWHWARYSSSPSSSCWPGPGSGFWRCLQGETLVSLTWVPVQLTQSVIPVGAILFIIAELLSLPAYWRQIAAGESSEH
jgi:TRAP-type C4-dicarboxylate transport system permease small subunit